MVGVAWSVELLAQPAVVGQRDGEERGDGQPAQTEFLVVRGILATPIPLGEPPADRGDEETLYTELPSIARKLRRRLRR
ncbi:hypothetical protein BZL54_21380 [Burkholderia ubonensis subsp. mesacidophila]|uniref:Uncharacterized protein n=1 Tax=Burkholderia ubonensis subsp. mesacidophila TaxID=265293 RepID=A0A2A4FAS5_9BURK|nr:hypothetical protein BZL54_21380 [Burkholderia ubonensis subsp. mesacidophila]